MNFYQQSAAPKKGVAPGPRPPAPLPLLRHCANGNSIWVTSWVC